MQMNFDRRRAAKRGVPQIEADARSAKRMLNGIQREGDARGGLKAARRSTTKATGAYYSGLNPAEKTSLVAGGLAAPAAALAGTLGAIRSDAGFNWNTQTISSLLNGPHAPLLRVGLTAAGLSSTYLYGLRESFPNSKVYTVGVAGLGLASAGVCIAGMTHYPSTVHDLSAGAYFLVAPSSIGVMGAAMAANGSRVSGGLTLAAAATALGAVVTGYLQKHDIPAKYEFIASSAIGMWVFTSAAYALIRNRVMDVPVARLLKSNEGKQ
ncbi:MAG: DUF998 domain-containing protein [Candidatus Micrarchaeota archaeon]|nr:DUF998 domain-containing protein [Candidatus Micrarchaeota archaeon]